MLNKTAFQVDFYFFDGVYQDQHYIRILVQKQVDDFKFNEEETYKND